MDLSVIKEQARQILRTRKRVLLLAGLLFLLLSAVFSVLNFLVIAPPYETYQRYLALVGEGQFQQGFELLQSYQPRFVETIASDLLNYLLAIVDFGLLMLIVHAIRGEEIAVGMLLDGFGQWWRVLLIAIWRDLLVSLGLVLLIVPGVFLAYSYRMAPYILLRHPEYGILDCMRESRRRMTGKRMELFVLDLSFLGWILLCCVPILGWVLALWVFPWYRCSEALFFEAVSVPFEDGSLPEVRTAL